MKVLKYILITMIISMVAASCAGVKIPKPELFQKSFTYLTTMAVVEICGPVKANENQKDGEKACIRIGPKVYTASGFVVKHENNKSFILTAGHFCGINRSRVIEDVVDAEELTSYFKDVDKVNVSVNFKVLDGNNLTKTAIVKNIDPLLDTCIMQTDRINSPALEFAEDSPEFGDELWNLASPLGIVLPKTVPVLKGIYSGSVIINERKAYVVTDLPAIYGSSGSPLLNYEGKIVGMVYSTNKAFNHVSFAVTLEDLREYVNNFFFNLGGKTTGTTTLEVIVPDFAK